MDQAVQEDPVTLEDEQQAVETTEQQDAQAPAEDAEQPTTDETADEDEITVSIGEETPPTEQPEQRAPEWVRDLRKSHRELQRQNRELKAALEANAPRQEQVTLGPKPTLEAFDYDTEKYEASLATWYERKRQADEQAERLQAQQREAAQAWQAKLESYTKARAEMKVKDFDDAEATAQELFDVTQQGVMLQGADNPALVVYALGKNPKKAQELAAIKDPVKFAFAVAKLETQLKVSSKKAAPPPPMKTASGAAPVAGNSEAALDRLRKEAAASGDYTKYLALKRSLSK